MPHSLPLPVQAFTATGLRLVHLSSATLVTLHTATGPVTVFWSDGNWLPSPASVALYVAHAFRFLSRFVDDLYAINCPLLSSLTYPSQSLPGFPEFTGIHPPRPFPRTHRRRRLP